DQVETGEVRAAGEEPDQRRDRGGHLVGPLVLSRRSIGHQLRYVIVERDPGRREDVLLAGELLIKGPPRDRRGVGYLADRGVRVDVFGGQLGNGRQQPLALVVGEDLGRDAVAPAG